MSLDPPTQPPPSEPEFIVSSDSRPSLSSRAGLMHQLLSISSLRLFFLIFSSSEKAYSSFGSSIASLRSPRIPVARQPTCNLTNHKVFDGCFSADYFFKLSLDLVQDQKIHLKFFLLNLRKKSHSFH